jgi:hypothetical protein
MLVTVAQLGVHLVDLGAEQPAEVAESELGE